MIALILFIHVGFSEYLSFKQFKLIVKMTRIESGVIYTLLECQESDGQNFLAAIVHPKFGKIIVHNAKN
jgi:hypothetical protein